MNEELAKSLGSLATNGTFIQLNMELKRLLTEVDGLYETLQKEFPLPLEYEWGVLEDSKMFAIFPVNVISEVNGDLNDSNDEEV